jgi:hypothetical protein
MRASDVKTIIPEVDPAKIKSPENNDKKFNQLFYLINLVLSDDFFETEEFNFVLS